MKLSGQCLTLGIIASLLGACGSMHPNASLSRRAQADQLHFQSAQKKLAYIQQGRAQQLIKELQARDYTVLEADLSRVDADFRKDPANELGYSAVIYGFVGCGTKAQEPELLEWTTTRPDSAWSHLSLGIYYDGMACSVRGEDWASNTSDQQFAQMDEYLAKARPELERAQRLDPKLAPAYWDMIIVSKMQGNLDAATAALNQSLKNAPASYLAATDYMDALSPRWLGSYEQMDAFAESMLAYLDKNPRYWELQGYVEAEKGDVAYRDNDMKTALEHYRAALAFGDVWSWLKFAGESARAQWVDGDALGYYMRVARYEKPMIEEDKKVLDNIVDNCKVLPKACVMDPKKFPWYGEPGPHDPADESPVKGGDLK